MRVLLLMAFLGLTNLIHAQNYLDSYPEWKEYSSHSSGPVRYIYDYTIRLESDTIINGNTYYKTKQEGVYIEWDWLGDTLVLEEILDRYVFPIREDQGRFYIYNNFHNIEYLIHDFNLNVGDTAVAASYCTTPQIVVEIDTIYFGTQMIRKFIFNPGLTFGSSPLFEGIGSSRGLFESPCCGAVSAHGGSVIQCYTNNGETLQMDNSGECETTTHVFEKNSIFNEFNIYPNPFDELILIENNFAESSTLNIRIYDLNGVLVKSSSKLYTGSSVAISTIELSSGVYILTLNTDTRFFKTRIIKI